jgi:hypothetical protein
MSGQLETLIAYNKKLVEKRKQEISNLQQDATYYEEEAEKAKRIKEKIEGIIS